MSWDNSWSKDLKELDRYDREQSQEADNRLKIFLRQIPRHGWHSPPKCWGEQFRQALGDGLVTVGWGGVLKLTDAGRAKAKET